VDSVSGASVPMLVVRKNSKKFFIATFTVDAGRAAFFVVWADSSLQCLFHLWTSLKPSTCWVLFFRIFLNCVASLYMCHTVRWVVFSYSEPYNSPPGCLLLS
jgi:hypothetical protein